MAVHLDYVGQTRAVRFSFMTFPLEGRKWRPENYATMSGPIEPSRDATPWGDYLVVFEHTAPDLSSLLNAMWADDVLVDRFEGAIAAFANRTAATHVRYWLRWCYDGTGASQLVYGEEEIPVRQI